MKTTVKIIGIILVVSLLSIGLKVLFFPVHVADKAADMAYGVVDKTLTADNAIYNYEYFKNQVQAFKAANRNADVANKALDTFLASAGPRDKWTFEDKQEYAHLSTVFNGLQMNVNNIAADYNAKSSMANRGIFKDGTLPEKL